MQHVYGLQDLEVNNAWLTIGSYDGVHSGHQALISILTAGARDARAPAVVLTFYPHPSMVFQGPRKSFYLMMPEEKAEQLGKIGVDVVITHPFDQQVANIKAEDFVRRLHERLGFNKLIVGHDFVLGRNRVGDVATLKKYGQGMGFEVIAVDPFSMDGDVVSSSRIRRLLEAGEMDQAARLLGRPFFLHGKVTRGQGRGRQIGVPTANLDIPKERAVPKAGVYACRVTYQGNSYQAVSNVGVRPTFEVEPVAPRVETHILDYNRDLYGEELKLSFLERLRDERRFPSVEDLTTQIRTDIARARQVLSR